MSHLPERPVGGSRPLVENLVALSRAANVGWTSSGECGYGGSETFLEGPRERVTGIEVVVVRVSDGPLEETISVPGAGGGEALRAESMSDEATLGNPKAFDNAEPFM